MSKYREVTSLTVEHDGGLPGRAEPVKKKRRLSSGKFYFLLNFYNSVNGR